MTPQESIKIIEVAKAECEWNAPLEYQEAFNMAIEALKEQPEHRQNTMQKQPDLNTFGMKTCETCEDVISRQAAIDALARTAREAFNLSDEYNQYLAGLMDGESAIRQLPSAQPEQRWIPCSERLPENDERVLATTAWGDVTIAERIYPPIDDTCWFIHDGNTNATIDDVVAWMPIIEPYEGE